jgi:hypothetical protein
LYTRVLSSGPPGGKPLCPEDGMPAVQSDPAANCSRSRSG